MPKNIFAITKMFFEIICISIVFYFLFGRMMEENLLTTVFTTENENMETNSVLASMIVSKNTMVKDGLVKSQQEPNFSEYMKFKEKLSELNSLFLQVESDFKCPESKIFQFFHDMRLEVDLRREVLLEEIHELSSDAISTIESLQEKCLANSSQAILSSSEKLQNCKHKLENLNSLDSAVLDDSKLLELMSFNKSNEGL